MNAPLPPNEIQRLADLQGYDILDSPREPAFDHITAFAAKHFKVPISLITFVDADRQWFKSHFGTDVHETERSVSLCSYTILSNEVMAVPDTHLDPRFADNPVVTGSPHVRSYAGAPLVTSSGVNLGTFCIIDLIPRQFSTQQLVLLQALSVIVMDEVDLRLPSLSHRDAERGWVEDLAQAQDEILNRLARAAEYRDDETGQHTQRVAMIAAALAQASGIPADHVELIRRASPLHDVGKIAISDQILLKPGKLTDEEFATMKTHTTIGAALLSAGHSKVVNLAEQIAASHHERWDGTGYPHQLLGEQIPIEARILAVADVFDALTHERPYKKAWSVAEAVNEIKYQSGKQFDPRVVGAFLTLEHEALV